MVLKCIKIPNMIISMESDFLKEYGIDERQFDILAIIRKFIVMSQDWPSWVDYEVALECL